MRAGLDKLDNSGWGVMLRLDYMAWLPPSKTEAKGVVAALGHRSGIAKVGHTHKHKKHKGDARAVRVHVPFEPPLLPPAGAPQGRSFTAAPQVVATVAGEPVRPTLGFGRVVFSSGQQVLFRRIVVPCGQQLGVGAQGQSFPDVHTVVVHGIDARGFNATVLRADSLGHGWSGNNVLHWLAWLPVETDASTSGAEAPAALAPAPGPAGE